MGLSEVLTYGANRYVANNRREVESKQFEAALLRHHLMEWKVGSAVAEESGLSHLKHVLRNVAFLVVLESRKTEGN